MGLNLRFLTSAQLESLCQGKMNGRLLSLNCGKSICVGVIQLSIGYAMFNYSAAQNAECPLHRGDVISFYGHAETIKGKSILKISRVDQLIPCKGILPNKQFKNQSSTNRILSVMFTPEDSALLKLKSKVMRYLRTTLYQMDFDEIQTPVLFNQRSPSNSPLFSVETVNQETLYLKAIHEHLLKPYLLVGFDRIFEIGPVFRNIKNAAQYDCEFTNADIWMKYSTLQELMQLCVLLAQGVRSIQGLPEMESKLLSYDDFVQNHGLDRDNRNAIKRFIRDYGKGMILLLGLYPKSGDSHIKSTADGLHNQEFHAFANGISFGHGYLVDTSSLLQNAKESDQCFLFEEYSKYGVDEFGGVGIGIEKMLQAMLEIEDFHKLDLYRRKY